MSGHQAATTTANGITADDSAVQAVQAFLDTLTVDPSTLTYAEVREQMQLVRAVHAVGHSRLMALGERMSEIALNAETPFPVDPTRELVRNGGLRRKDVRALDVQAAAADAAPQLGQLLAQGATTPGHLDAMGLALQIAGDGREQLLDREDEIARRASSSTVDDFAKYVKRLAIEAQPDEGVSRFEQQRRNTFLKTRTDANGMILGNFAFDAEYGAAVVGRLDRDVEAMFHSGNADVDVAPGIDPNDHRRALAFYTLCVSGGTNDSDSANPVDAKPARAEVIVHIDLQTLRHGLHANGVCRTGQGADIPPAVARRIACEADIIPVVLDGRSVPLDIGRAKRLATIHQRRLLESVHDTCAVPDCDVGFTRCVIHHLDPWEHGGPTDIGNMIPLCNRHHHAVHEGGWTITLDPTTRHVTAAPPLSRHAAVA